MSKTVTRYRHFCVRCERSFDSKYRQPLRCGKCKSPYWNRPRSQPGNQPRRQQA